MMNAVRRGPVLWFCPSSESSDIDGVLVAAALARVRLERVRSGTAVNGFGAA
jgi:hypothetical protein